MVKGMPKRPTLKRTPLQLRTVPVTIRVPWWAASIIGSIAEGEKQTFPAWVRNRLLADPRVQAMNPARKSKVRPKRPTTGAQPQKEATL